MSGLDLYLSQRTLALMFVYAVLTGFCLGPVYDGLRILRMALGDSTAAEGSVRRKGSTPETREPVRRPLLLTVLLFAEDLVFMLVASVALILLVYYTNDGQLRAPAPVGMACGFFAYIHTVSRWVLRLAEAILGLVRRMILGVGKICLHWAIVPLKALWSRTAGRMAAAHREQVTQKRIQELKESAKCGFDLLDKDEKTQEPPA